VEGFLLDQNLITVDNWRQLLESSLRYRILVNNLKACQGAIVAN